jgi:hypothetical protein
MSGTSEIGANPEARAAISKMSDPIACRSDMKKTKS